MSFEPNNDLQRAIERLTVQDIWRKVGLPDCPREGNHVVKSPLREERNASFSICFKGKGWRDFATGESGSVWEFARLTTGKEGKELADWLIEASGIMRTAPRPDSSRGGAESQSQVPVELRGLDPKKIAAAVKRSEKAKEEREAEKRNAQARIDALAPAVPARRVEAWSDGVQGRWRDGTQSLSHALALAKSRGWPLAWVTWLVSEDLISWPLLPWTDETAVACRVDAPDYVKRGEAWTLQGLRTVGYHQRFEIQGRKSWVYVPYFPAEEKAKSPYQQALRAECIERGAEEGASVVPALPFFMGCLVGVRFLVVTEGQWDAITFAGACGWLTGDTTWPEGVAVMGVRGASGVDTLLAYWGAWLEAERPAVLVLADNDAAGRRWDEPEETEPGVLPRPTFCEKLLNQPGDKDGDGARLIVPVP